MMNKSTRIAIVVTVLWTSVWLAFWLIDKEDAYLLSLILPMLYWGWWFIQNGPGSNAE